MRVATYTRISTDEAHRPYSLEAQATRLKSYIDSQPDWELVKTFTDQKSGATTDRPGLQRAVSEAKAKRFDLLLVYGSTASPAASAGSPTCLRSSTRRGWRSAARPSRSTPPRQRGG